MKPQALLAPSRDRQSVNKLCTAQPSWCVERAGTIAHGAP